MDDRRFGEGEFRWSAYPPKGHVDHDERRPGPVGGTHIRLMCDYGVVIPLWDEGGLLPENPQYLERELGIGQELISDLALWAADWEVPSKDPDQTQAWIACRREHREEGRRLLARLQVEINPRFTVSLKL